MSFTKRLNAAERRKEIMDAAAKIIALKGLEKTTMEEIIAGTKLSKGGVYHYYRSVIEIFKDIMLEGIKYRNEIIKNVLMLFEKEKHQDIFLSKKPKAKSS